MSSVWQLNCFNDLGLSRLEIEPRSPAYDANALPLSHRGGVVVLYNPRYRLLLHIPGTYTNFSLQRRVTSVLCKSVT